MSERIGVVLNAFDDHTAEVVAEKRSACGGCQDTRNCKTCLTGSNKIVAIVQNDAGANPGDVVTIQHKRDAILGGAALFYTLPVVTLMVGAFTGGAVAAGWGISETSGAVLAGLAGLAIGLLAVAWVGRTEFARLRLVPHIIGIVESGSKEGAPIDAKSFHQKANRACCG